MFDWQIRSILESRESSEKRERCMGLLQQLTVSLPLSRYDIRSIEGDFPLMYCPE